jgi:hypothetical protein
MSIDSLHEPRIDGDVRITCSRAESRRIDISTDVGRGDLCLGELESRRLSLQLCA